jgi:hypothetical protein
LHSWKRHLSRKCKQNYKVSEHTKKKEAHYIQNKMFKQDTIKFYRNLGTKHIAAKVPLCIAEIQPYWKSLLG